MRIYSKLIMVTTLLIIASGSVFAKEEDQNKSQKHQRPDFTSIDLDGDGSIHFDEFLSHELPRGDHETVFNNIDTDGDGVISQEEFKNHKPPRDKKRKGNRDE